MTVSYARLMSSIAGFTLIEAMFSAMILSLGALLIYQSFFMSLDAFNYCNNYLDVSSRADDKLWEAQDELTRFGTLIQTQTSGRFTKAGRDFNWGLSSYPIDELHGLYNIDLVLYWQEGRKTPRITRSAYAIYKQEKQ